MQPQRQWRWTADSKAAVSQAYVARADAEMGLWHVDRGVDVRRTFAQSVARARDPRRRVLRDGTNWRLRP